MKKIFGILALALSINAFADTDCEQKITHAAALEKYTAMRASADNYAAGGSDSSVIKLWKDACIIKRFDVKECDVLGEDKTVSVWNLDFTKDVRRAVQASVAAVCNDYLDKLSASGKSASPRVMSYELVTGAGLIDYFPVHLVVSNKNK